MATQTVTETPERSAYRAFVAAAVPKHLPQVGELNTADAVQNLYDSDPR